MQETVRWYEDGLPEGARTVRTSVFMDEQGFVNEFDQVDAHALHLVLLDGGSPVATCRLFRDEASGEWTVGRIAVVRERRGGGLGARVLREAEREAARRGAARLVLHAQVRAQGFYERCGYEAYGKEDLDEGCPHVWMRREL